LSKGYIESTIWSDGTVNGVHLTEGETYPSYRGEEYIYTLRYPDINIAHEVTKYARRTLSNSNGAKFLYSQDSRYSLFNALNSSNNWDAGNLPYGTYYSDCSSFICTMWRTEGYRKGISSLYNLSLYTTYQMRDAFEAAGFQVLRTSEISNFKSGDIILAPYYHVVLYFNDEDAADMRRGTYSDYWPNRRYEDEAGWKQVVDLSENDFTWVDDGTYNNTWGFWSDATEPGGEATRVDRDTFFKKIKDAGIKGAIIRVGYTGSTTGSPVVDEEFVTNITSCLKIGLPCGFYWEASQCKTADQAKNAANKCIELIEKYLPADSQPELPVYVDLETGSSYESLYGYYPQTVSAFCSTIKKHSNLWTTGLYSSESLWNTSACNWKLSDFSYCDYHWGAKWTPSSGWGPAMPISGLDFTMWQFDSNRKIADLNNHFDLSLANPGLFQSNSIPYKNQYLVVYDGFHGEPHISV
jgi:hypothetical protein